MGELFEVLGALRFSAQEACPAELKGKTVKLKAKEGDVFEVPAEAACISAKVRKLALQDGTEKEISLPLKKPTVAKVLEYLKHHKDHPAGEIITPLFSDDLAECGATKWDAKFIEVDKAVLFDLSLAASLLDIAGLFFLASAKAAVLYKDKSSDKLRKEFNFLNDLSPGEEEAMAKELKAKGKARQDDANADIAALAVTLQATAIAAEKQGCLDTARTEDGAPVIDPKSWRHATWRAAVLLDWHQLAIAPAEVRGDRDLMLGALMTSQGAALAHASPALRGDKEVVLEATKYYGTAFKEASDALRNDREFVMEAIAKHGAALGGAGESLRSDKGLVLEAAKKGYGSALEGASAQLRRDQDFVLQVATADPAAFKHAAEELRNDKLFALRVAEKSGRALQYMPAKFKADKEVVAAAVGENAAAALFAHTSRRSDMGMELPWDTQGQHKEQYVGAAGVLQAGQTPGGPRMITDPFGEALPYRHHKIHKTVGFTAMSTMMGNMGQANYTAANIYLDKIPAYQRPEIDSVGLMWGAVGGIGMRWKAFASADMLNATPDILLSINDACKILNVTCTKMDPPEWYTSSFIDEFTRNAMLGALAGGTGGGWKPSEDAPVYPPVNWRPDGLQKGFLIGKDLEDERVPRDAVVKAAPDGTPLGGWPGLVGMDGGVVVEQRPAPLPSYELEIGARVMLMGLSSKNGTTGILVKSFADGKWKVRLEDGSGNALLRGCYLKAIQPASEVAKEGAAMLQAGASATELRRAKLEERRSRLKEKSSMEAKVVTVGGP